MSISSCSGVNRKSETVSAKTRHFLKLCFSRVPAEELLNTPTISNRRTRNLCRRDFADHLTGFVFSLQTTASTRKWKKEVDRSLYSSRAYASKNPTLSPIKERRSFGVQPPAESESASSKGNVQETKRHYRIVND